MANVPTVSTSVGLPQIIGSWAGSALGGPVGGFIGNALGGAVSGLFGKKKRGPDEGDQIVMRGRALDADVAQKIETGKKYGIHPLTMLGVQSPYVGQSTMSSSGPSFGQDLAMQGVDLARSVAAGQSNMERLQERLITAQIEGQEIDNVSRASMLARANQPGTGPNGVGLSETISKMNVNKVGYRDDMQPLHTIGYDEAGDPIRFYNEELGDNEIAQALHAFRYTIPDYLSNKGNRVGRSFGNFFRNYKFHKFPERR